MLKKLQITLSLFLLCITTLFAQVSFTASTTSGCAPLTVNFTNTSTVGNYYEWVFYDGSPTITGVNPTHTFYNPMMYQVMLTAYDTTGGGMNNLGSYYLPGGINVTGSNLNITADTACPGEQVSMYIYPYGNNIMWNFGDGSTSTMQEADHTYSNPGTYTITVSANTSCGMQTITKQIVIMNNASPSAQFNMRSPICPGDMARFYPRNYNATSYAWNFGDGGTSTDDRPEHVYAAPGNYPVTLTITSSCGTSATRVDTMRVESNLTIGNYVQIFSSTDLACPGDLISFDYNLDEVLMQEWSFGTGDSATTKNPEYAYDTAGTYVVSLHLTNGCGNDTTITKTITIGSGLPFTGSVGMEFFPNPACPNDMIQFSSQPATSYLWDFGGGNTATTESTLYSFTSVGNHPVSLTLTNGCGSDTTITDTVSISNSIVPYLDHSNNGNWGTPSGSACPGDTVVFYTFGGSSYLWDFGDGSTSTVTEQITLIGGDGQTMILDVVRHAFATVGTYSVSLTYYNGCGNSAIDSLEFTVGSNEPVQGGITISSTSLTACDTIQFFGIGGDTYEWSFGDGDTVTTSQATVSHHYSVPGTYNVNVLITNNCGNSESYSDIITIEACAPIGITDQRNNVSVKLYPNPFSASATLGVEGIEPGSVFEVYDLVGKTVYSTIINASNTTIERGDLNNGLYIYQIKSSGHVLYTGKMILE